MIIFEKAGPENTKETLELAIKKALEIDSPIVIATTQGQSLLALKDRVDELGLSIEIIGVSHAYGSRVPGENLMSEELRQSLLNRGVKIVTAAHTLSGCERGLSSVFKGVYPVEIMAHTLRMFGQGTKVCVEIGAMALDAGVIPYGKEIVMVGGTGRGSDTVCTITPEYSSNIIKTRIHEMICKPR